MRQQSIRKKVLASLSGGVAMTSEELAGLLDVPRPAAFGAVSSLYQAGELERERRMMPSAIGQVATHVYRLARKAVAQ